MQLFQLWTVSNCRYLFPRCERRLWKYLLVAGTLCAGAILQFAFTWSPIQAQGESSSDGVLGSESASTAWANEYIVALDRASRDVVVAQIRLNQIGELVHEATACGSEAMLQVWRVDKQEQTHNLQAVAGIPGVRYIEPNWIVRAAGAPYKHVDSPLMFNDTYYQSHQWSLQNSRFAGAWQLIRDNRVLTHRVRVAVIDSGVDFSHPDLTGRLLPGINYVSPGATPNDDFGHGTQVAGVIAAVTDNSKGIAGGAPDVEIDPRKILGSSGSGSIVNLVQAICDAADNNADVINLSVEVPASLSSDLVQQMQAAADYAHAKGILLIASAGNSNRGPVYYPGRLNHVVAVAALTRENALATYSAIGTQVDIAASGGDFTTGVLSTWPSRETSRCTGNGQVLLQEGDAYYCTGLGTSIAAPHVSAAASLLLSVWPNLGVTVTESILESSARDVGLPQTEMGAGLLDIEASLQDAFSNLSPPDVDQTPPSGAILSPGSHTVLVPGYPFTLFASARDNEGGSGVKRVRFYVYYNNDWHHLNDDLVSPYETTWAVPEGLLSQEVKFGIHVEDNVGNYVIDPVAPVSATLIQSGVVLDVRYADQVYIQQQMEDGYWTHCGPTSLAMLLHFLDVESRDPLYNRAATLELVCDTKIEAGCKGGTSLAKLKAALQKREVDTVHRLSPQFSEIRHSIDAGAPVILSLAQAAHIVVVTGYTSDGRVILNDPYGAFQWWKCDYPDCINLPFAQASPKFTGYAVSYTYGQEVSGKYAIFVEGALPLSVPVTDTIGTSGGIFYAENVSIDIPGVVPSMKSADEDNYQFVFAANNDVTAPLPDKMTLVQDFVFSATDSTGVSRQRWHDEFEIEIVVDASILEQWLSTDGISVPSEDALDPSQEHAEFGMMAWDNISESWTELPVFFDPDANRLVTKYDLFTEYVVTIQMVSSDASASDIYLPYVAHP